MTANELRIRNHIKFECDTLHMTTFGIITGIEQHFQYKDGRRTTKSTYGASLIDQWGNERQADVVDIEPIPLTPEILEKAGLKPKRLLGHTIKYNIEGDSEATGELLIIKESIGYVAAVGRKGSIVVLNVIRHLHQLQNIYFFLSGTELNIQL